MSGGVGGITGAISLSPPDHHASMRVPHTREDEPTKKMKSKDFPERSHIRKDEPSATCPASTILSD